MKPDVSVIIVNYNTREMTLKCLDALRADLTGINAEVILVDNASSDGSVEAIRAHAPWVQVIASEKNLGFGAGNNVGLKIAQGDYFLLLNTDALPHAGAIQALLTYMQTHPKTAVVGPRLLNADGSVQQSCFRFPTPLRSWLENLWISAILRRVPAIDDYRGWAHDREREVDFVIGACVMVRRSVYEQIGGFDERFFMYAEESDWMYCMHRAGWTISFTPSAVVTHLGGASGASDKPKINQIFFESLDHYELKHHGVAGLVSLRAAMTIGCGLRAALWTLVMAASRKRRTLARSKVRVSRWLMIRQMTSWNILSRASA
ncbi:MAG: glycosyltransferase family 2 protein [Burkholderiales bacterium]|nr:glycosyltransferase family 2 protein [Phycisphaerae bacterium]